MNFAMAVRGGPVRGGRVYRQWPRLQPEKLNAGRDQALTMAFRDVFGEVLSRHLGLRDRTPPFSHFPANSSRFRNILVSAEPIGDSPADLLAEADGRVLLEPAHPDRSVASAWGQIPPALQSTRSDPRLSTRVEMATNRVVGFGCHRDRLDLATDVHGLGTAGMEPAPARRRDEVGDGSRNAFQRLLPPDVSRDGPQEPLGVGMEGVPEQAADRA